MALTKISTGMLKQDAASSDLNIDAGTLYLDVSNNRVGINTTSPNNRLEISGGNIRIINHSTGRITFNNGSTEAFFGFNGAGSSTLDSGALPLQVQAQGSNHIRFDTNSSERMRIDSSGRVGVGVTPKSWLTSVDVIDVGTSAAAYYSGGVTHNAYFDNTNNRWEYKGTGAATFYNIQGGAHVWSYAASGTADNPITFNEAMRIDSSGRVGIGTATPNGNGQLTINSAADNSPQIVFSENDTQKWLIGHRHDGDHFRFYDLANSAERMRIDGAGRVLIGTSDTSPWNNTGTDTGIMLSYDGWIAAAASSQSPLELNRMSNDGNIINLRKDGAIRGRIANDSTSLVVTGSSTGLKFGSAAIWPTTGGGVTNSNGAKDLGASTAKFKDLYLSGTIAAGTGTSASTATISAYSRTVSSGLVSALRIIESTGASTYWDIGANNGSTPSLNFYVNANTSPKMTLAHSGNVGIGTTNPQTALHIYDTPAEIVRMQGNDEYAYASFYGTVSSSEARLGYMGFANDTSTAADFNFANNQGGIFSFNAGIDVTGAITSSANGAITTANGTTARFSVNETGGAITAMDARGSTGNIGTRSNHTLGFLVNDVQKATLTAGGDFTVTNDLKLTTTNPRIDYDNNGSGALRFYSMSAAQERARITSSGKMIIGDVNTDTTDALQIQSPASGGGYGIQLRRDDSNADQQMGRILFGNNSNNDLAQIAAKTDGSTDNSAIFFSTRPTSGALTERMRIDSGGALYLGSGHLTSAPSDGVIAAAYADGYNNAGGNLQFYGGRSTGDNPGGEIQFFTGAAGSSGTQVNSHSERMRIDSSGHVIINKSNFSSLPTGSKLNIFGDGITLRLDGSSNTTKSILFRQTGVSNPGEVYADGSLRFRTEDASTRITFHTNSSGSDNERMRIDSSGNVGIGTDSPAVRLHSHNTTGSPEIRLTTGLDTGTPTSQIGYSSGSGYFLRLGDSSNNEDVMFRTYGDSYIANKLGIGVASPDQKLHVNSGGTNIVARFESTDAIGGIMLKDNTGNVELETYGGAFRVNPGGLSSPISFSSGATSNYFTTNTVHSGTNQDFDLTIANLTTSNYGPRVRIYGGGQSGGASADVPWDNQQGYNTGSLWFDSGEGPSIYGAGIAGVAEQDFNNADTPSALAFYTTPDGTGGATNTAKERFRLRADGTAHLSPTESNTHLYLGSAGGLTGGNNSINIRAAGNNMMLNSVGQLIVESTGVQKFLVDEVYTKVTTNTTDRYNLRVESSSTGDPGLSMWRAGQAGFGINVRTSSTNYADFMVSTGGEPAYNAAGTTNAPIRIYQDNHVSIPHSAVWSTGIGNTFGSTGNHYMIRNSNSIGNESIIVNNILSGGSTGILQYRINAGVQGQYLIGQSGSGITFTGSSDYRLKENVSTITESSLDKINQLRLVSYNWNDLSDMPTDTTEIGVIAHEIEEVFPEFVDGEKDAVYTQEELDARGDPETTNEEVGDIKPQTVSLVNKDMIVHILKAMQELKAENDALRARIEVLEA